MEDEAYQVLDLSRREDGTIEATVRYESGLTVVRSVKSVTVEAKVQRAEESREMGTEDEDLGIVAATYSNPASEILARYRGLGSVTVQDQ